MNDIVKAANLFENIFLCLSFDRSSAGENGEVCLFFCTNCILLQKGTDAECKASIQRLEYNSKFENESCNCII